jgi:hypothetical protein
MWPATFRDNFDDFTLFSWPRGPEWITVGRLFVGEYGAQPSPGENP